MPDRAIGIDLGGTQLRAALVDATGAVLARTATLTDVAGGPEAVLRQMLALVAEIAPQGAALPCGVSSPGPLDSDSGTVLGIPTLPGWDGFPLRARLQAALGRPVALENDGIAAAYGEWRHGAGVGLRHMVYVTVSTGIGGGVVLDGRLLRGRRGMAGHVGHIRMVADGPRCACGAIGCFEALAAGPALARAGQDAARRHPGSALARHGAPTAQDVMQAARDGDAAALEVAAAEAEILGIGFASLIHLFSPERVVIGGGVSAGFDLMRLGIADAIARHAMPAFRDVTVAPAGLGGNSGLVGAAALALAGGDASV